MKFSCTCTLNNTQSRNWVMDARGRLLSTREAKEAREARALCDCSLSLESLAISQVHPLLDGRTLTLNQLFENIDIILSTFSFSEFIVSLKTCIPMASFLHQRASTRLWSTLMTWANCLTCRLLHVTNITSFSEVQKYFSWLNFNKKFLGFIN